MRPRSVVDTSALRGRDLNTYFAKSVAGSTDVTLTLEEASAGALEFTGALTGNISVIFPLLAENQGQGWYVKNSTTGRFTLTVKVTGQTGAVIEQNEKVTVVCNGTDLYRSAPNKIPRRFELRWVGGQHGKPGLNALLTNSVANYAITDRDFEVQGTNAVSADCTYNADGGVQIASHGADGDQTLLAPHLLANCSPWTAITWGTHRQTEWECHVKTGANITNAIIWAGLKLSNTPVKATDADQVYFRYQDTVNSGKWEAVDSVATVLTSTDALVPNVLSTEYHLAIRIDSSRIARCYLNGALVRTTAALTNTTNLIPYVGVSASGAAAAKALIVYGQAISRVYA